MEEQRSAPRFKASIPVEVGDDGGLTIDISSSGIAFDSERRYQIGEQIPLRLRLGEGPFPLNLECRGRVVRVDEHNGTFTIATTVEWLEQEVIEYAE